MKKILFLFTGLLFFFSGFTQVTERKDQNAWLPKDISPKDITLLIITTDIPKNDLNDMRRYMKKKYPYPYKFIEASDMQSNTYKDKTMYRFTLNSTWFNLVKTSRNTGETKKEKFLEFYFYDRAEKKEFPSTRMMNNPPHTSFKKVIDKLIKMHR